jgi:hypothetical protein
MHGASFAPHKYVLVHFPKKKRYLPITPLELPTFTLHPSPHARVLGLILDSKLSWHPHISLIKSKLRTQTFALIRLTFSTWGAPFSSCCLLYTYIVRFAITYASTVWYSTLGTPYACKYVLKDLMLLQNNCLRAISGAYRATPIRKLEVEVGVLPLGIQLDSIQARFRVRLEESEAAGAIREAVEKVERWIGGGWGTCCWEKEKEGKERDPGDFKRRNVAGRCRN